MVGCLFIYFFPTYYLFFKRGEEKRYFLSSRRLENRSGNEHLNVGQCFMLKEHWTSVTSSPNFFPPNVKFFIPLEVLALIMTACWFIPSYLTFEIFSISYFSKSTSINTKHSGLWDISGMILFSKDLIKYKLDVTVSPEVTRILPAFAVTPNHPLVASDPTPSEILN